MLDQSAKIDRLGSILIKVQNHKLLTKAERKIFISARQGREGPATESEISLMLIELGKLESNGRRPARISA